MTATGDAPRRLVHGEQSIDIDEAVNVAESQQDRNREHVARVTAEMRNHLDKFGAADIEGPDAPEVQAVLRGAPFSRGLSKQIGEK